MPEWSGHRRQQRIVTDSGQVGSAGSICICIPVKLLVFVSLLIVCICISVKLFVFVSLLNYWLPSPLRERGAPIISWRFARGFKVNGDLHFKRDSFFEVLILTSTTIYRSVPKRDF